MNLVKSRFRTKKGGGFCATNSSLGSSFPVGVVGTTLKRANETSPHLSEEKELFEGYCSMEIAYSLGGV